MTSKKMTSDQYKKKRQSIRTNNFLEALRDLGGGVVDSAINDVVGGIAETAFTQVSGRKNSGDLKPNQPFEFSKAPQEDSFERKTQQFQREFLNVQHQERLIFKQAEQETKMQIAAVIQELKTLSLSTKNLAREVEVASLQAPVEPGVYHLNFFEKLRQTLIILRKKIDESANWLAAFNQRSKKKNYFWGQFKKSGTKFLLSQERYMSTQAG